MGKMWSSARNRALTIGAVVLVALIATAGITYAVLAPKALPRTEVAGLSVAGLTEEQVSTLLSEQSLEATLTTPEGERQINLSDAGVTVDVPGTVTEVFTPNHSVLSVLGGVFTSRAVTPLVTVDDDKLQSFADTIALPQDQQAVDAAVIFGDDAFSVTPSRDGAAVDDNALKEALIASAATWGTDPITVVTKEQTAAFSTEQAQAAAEQANAWLGMDIILDDGDGVTLSPDIATRADWIAFSDTDLSPTLDRDKVKAWVDKAGKETEIAPTPGIRNVDETGTVVATVHGPKSGWVVSNADAVTDAVVSGLTSSSPVYATFDYVEKNGEWEERPADPATKGLRYRAAAGEKWIDLDLSEATVTAYEGAEVVAGPFAMVPGAPETPTVTGEFNIYLKYDIQTMRGTNADGTPYETPDVPWVSYFEGGYGFHGAPWRSSFGWNGPGGSHGCINMPVDQAKFIYDWADMGTKVISHH